MRIHGIERLKGEELERELAAGGRFVVFEYCISLVVVTARRPTSVYFLRAGEVGLLRGLPFSFLSVLLGWWGVPWGIIYTPLVLLTNFSGGCDVTHAILPSLSSCFRGGEEVPARSGSGPDL